jgi:HEAT repeat protein
MSQSFAVECPYCHARGELADPGLIGQAIACPACQQVFMVAAAPPVSAPPVSTPVVSPTGANADSTAAIPVAHRPLPTATGTGDVPHVPGTATEAPTAAFPGATDPAFVAELQQDLPRSAMRPRKPESKWVPMVVWGGISGTLLVWAMTFLMGLPNGRPVLKPSPDLAKPEARRPPRNRPKQSPEEESVAMSDNQFQQPSDPANMAPNDLPKNPTKAIPKELQPGSPDEPMKVPTKIPATPTTTPTNDEQIASQTQENMPEEVKAKLEYAYQDEALPMLIELLGHPHAGVRSRAAELVGGRDLPPEAVKTLIKLLKDPSDLVRVATAHAFRKHGPNSPDSVPALGAVLRGDRSRDVRVAAAATLQQIAAVDADHARAVAAEVIPALRNADENDVSFIASACGPLGEAGEPAVPLLIELLNNDLAVPEVAGALAELGQIEPLREIIATKGINHYSAKTNIARAIGRQRAMSPAILEVLKTLFQDTDEMVRESAITALKTCEPKLSEAIPLIEQAQSDPDDDVRGAAAEALAKYEVSAEQKVRVLLKQLSLSKPDSFERSQIESALRDLKADGLSNVIATMGNVDAAPEVRVAASLVLTGPSWGDELIDPANVAALKALTAEPQHPLVVRGAAAAAIEFGRRRNPNFDERASLDPEIYDLVRAAIAAEDLDFAFRRQVLSAVNIYDPKIVPVLVAVAEKLDAPIPDDTPNHVKSERNVFHFILLDRLADSSFRQRDPSIALPRFLAAVQSGSPDVRVMALARLSSLGGKSPESVAAARSVLKHPASNVRAQAIETLGDLHDLAADAIPEIQHALKDESGKVRETAAETLGKFGQAAIAAVPDLLAVIEGDEKTINGQAPVALARIAPKEAAVLDAFVKALEATPLNDNIVDALVQMGPETHVAVPALRKRMSVANQFQLGKILRLFAKLGPAAKDALPEIIEQLKYPDQYVREYAIEAIGKLKNEGAEAIPELVKLLNDENKSISLKAITALQQIGSAAKAAIPDLEQLAVATTDDQIRRQVRTAIGRLNADPNDVDSTLAGILASDDWQDELQQMSTEPTELFVPLARLTRNSDAEIRQRAESYLRKLAHSDSGKVTLEKLLEGDDAGQQALAAVLLNRLPTRMEPPELARQLATWSSNESHGWIASRLIVRLGQSAPVAIAEAITNESLSTRSRGQLLDHYRNAAGWKTSALFPLLREIAASDNAARRRAAIVAIASLNPREPDVLPAVLECLTGEDLPLRLRAISILRGMADEEVDISAAVPELMTFFAAGPFNWPAELGEESQSLTYLVNAALLRAKLQPQHLETLRTILRTDVELAEMNQDNEQRRAAAQQHGWAAIQMLGKLGPQSVEAIPDIKAFLTIVAVDYDSRPLSEIGESVIPVLTELALQADLPEKNRISAIRLLDGMTDGNEQTQQTLLKLLPDADPAISTHAAVLLSRNPAHLDATIPVLREGLKTKDRVLLISVIQTLEGLGNRASVAIPDLVALTGDKELWIRQTALRGLLKIDPQSEDVQRACLEWIKSPPEYSAVPWKDLGEPLIPRLIDAVEASSDPLRWRAALVLGDFGEAAKSAVPALQKLMMDDHSDAGTAAAVSLARIDPSIPESVPVVIEAFKNRKFLHQTLEGLRRLGPQASEVVPIVLERIKNKDQHYPLFSLLGAMGPAAKPALPMLVQMMTTEDRHLAVAPLESLGEQAAEVAPELIALLHDADAANSIPRILKSMGQPGRDAVELIRKQLDTESTRLEGLMLLSNFGTLAEPATDQLTALAQDADVNVRILVLKTLGNCRGRGADIVPLLATALSDPDPRVAGAAASSLATLVAFTAPVRPQILDAFEKDRDCTRWQLLQIIQTIGTDAKDAVPTLNKLTTSPDEHWRRRARKVLSVVLGEASPETP